MEKNKGVIQELLKYKYELGYNAKEATRNINRAKKVDYATAKRWYSKFRSGKLDVADKKRSGRSREVDRVAVVNAVEAHPSMTLRMLADDFDCHHSEIAKILHEAEFFKSKTREWYRRRIYQLEDQWQKVIENNGEYFDY
uniref:Mos1 transposase HTH domain-containing protein n=1 Tax=Acrobeloides nanus TaxID=290746 RepID=A0A914EJP4_9BILA